MSFFSGFKSVLDTYLGGGVETAQGVEGGARGTPGGHGSSRGSAAGGAGVPSFVAGEFLCKEVVGFQNAQNTFNHHPKRPKHTRTQSKTP